MTNTVPNKFPAMMVQKVGDQFERSVENISINDLPDGEITIEVVFSSLNYKDALAATGNPGVSKNFPHVPGIDAVGKIVHTDSLLHQVGDEVLIGNADFGTSVWGGYSRFIRVPEDWVIALPMQLTMRSAISLGTAGFTAAQSVKALIDDGTEPGDGEVIVTGATGGVGIISVMLLAKLGFNVVASTGKQNQAGLLKRLGASRIIGREELNDDSGRPLLSSAWRAGIDTVGGNTLSTLLRSTSPHGCVTACGVVGGAELPITVYPFILRGVKLHGIDSAGTPKMTRLEIWEKLAVDWYLDALEEITEDIGLEQLSEKIDSILAGQVAGRVVVDMSR